MSFVNKIHPYGSGRKINPGSYQSTSLAMPLEKSKRTPMPKSVDTVGRSSSKKRCP
jgi:hypothetical protein